MDIATIVHLVVYLIVCGIILGLLLYLVSISPVPEPYKGWIRFLVIALTILLIIYLLLGLVSGGGLPRMRVGQTSPPSWQQVFIPAPPSIVATPN